MESENSPSFVAEARVVLFSQEFAANLEKRKETAKTDFVIEYKGKPMRKFRNSFQTACRKAGITYPCRMYDIRHLFATVMLAGGADLAAVSKLLGHSTTHETANVYYELLKGKKQKAVSLLPSIVPAAAVEPQPQSRKVVSITRQRRT